MTAPLVTVVMLACNKAPYTRLALHALAQTAHPRMELAFVDNGSVDETPAVVDAFADAVRERGWIVRRRRFDHNVGAIAGRNAALEDATGDFIVFLDNDVVLGQRAWVARLLARFDAESDLGILGGKLLYANPPHDIQCAGCDVYRNGRVDFRGRGQPRDTPAFNQPMDVPCLISALWMMRGALARTLGPLDRQFDPVQFEDIDYCYRARAAGWRVAYEPSVYGYHYENVTTDGGEATRHYLRLTIRNGLKFKRKWADEIRSHGLPDRDAPPWKDIPRVPLDAAPPPPMVD